MNNSEQKGLRPVKSAHQLVDMYYNEARSHLLETAAILDRIERAQGSDAAMGDSRIRELFKICDILVTTKHDRAETVLNTLSVT